MVPKILSKTASAYSAHLQICDGIKKVLLMDECNTPNSNLKRALLITQYRESNRKWEINQISDWLSLTKLCKQTNSLEWNSVAITFKSTEYRSEIILVLKSPVSDQNFWTRLAPSRAPGKTVGGQRQRTEDTFHKSWRKSHRKHVGTRLSTWGQG